MRSCAVTISQAYFLIQVTGHRIEQMQPPKTKALWEKKLKVFLRSPFENRCVSPNAELLLGVTVALPRGPDALTALLLPNLTPNLGVNPGVCASHLPSNSTTVGGLHK